MREEIFRKLIHVATVTVPLLVWLLPGAVAVSILGLLAGAALVVEWARFRVPAVRELFLRHAGRLLRPHEHRGLAGATYMVIAYFLAALLFPREVAVAAMLYNGLGDAAAALVGKRWGRHRTRWGKSWEGAASALVVCLLVGVAVPGLAWPSVLLGALAAATLEFLPLPLDDNLRVTLGGGAAAWLGTLLA